MPTIKEIKECLATIDDLDHPLFEELILDGRAGRLWLSANENANSKNKWTKICAWKNASLRCEKELYTQGIYTLLQVWMK